MSVPASSPALTLNFWMAEGHRGVTEVAAMLSDRERATLDEIQDRILAEDPGFARGFEGALQQRNRVPGKAVRRRALHVLPWCTTALAVLLLMAGSLGAAALVAMLGVALWMARC